MALGTLHRQAGNLWRITCTRNRSKAPQFSYQWMGATWLFATAENRDRFQAEPERYAPQYGGYCAYAVSKGRTASIDPEAWRVVDGKLYLNYSKGVQKKWEQDVTWEVIKTTTTGPICTSDLSRVGCLPHGRRLAECRLVMRNPRVVLARVGVPC